METVDILIIGGGAAGIAAACAAFDAGCRSILVADRGPRPGGILSQCTHRGFGNGCTGPEYTARLLQNFPRDIRWEADTEVLSVSRERIAVLSSARRGLYRVSFQCLVYAAGCREIPIGSLLIGGTRPKGIYTAGQMQAMMNLDGFLPEGPVVILGSGDMGLIMANQIADAGIPVTLVERKDSCPGFARNRSQVDSGRISLFCSQTIVSVLGHPTLEGVVLSGGETLPCRTLLIAVGLIPDQELIRGLNHPSWLQICGNCNQVHSMVEAVVKEGKAAGIAACACLRGIV